MEILRVTLQVLAALSIMGAIIGLFVSWDSRNDERASNRAGCLATWA
ncbi:hypothetical protein AB0B56_17470 [Streptosporangium canum]